MFGRGKKTENDARSAKASKSKGMRIRDWKGLLGDADRKTRIAIFALLILVSISMTFTQMGFIGIGTDGVYAGYVLGLLGPVSLAALLLGKGWGTLHGLLSGLVLLAHARFQPLDIYERYFVSPLNSVVLYSLAGFMLGLLFAVSLRKNPKRRAIRLFVVALVTSISVTLAFLANAIVNLATIMFQEGIADPAGEVMLPQDTVMAITALGGLDVQIACDLLLIFLTSVACNRIVMQYNERRNYISLRAVFNTRLFVAVFSVFLVVQAFSFTSITIAAERNASKKMNEEIDFIGDLLVANHEYAIRIINSPDFSELSDDMIQRFFDSDASERLVDGYDTSDGTLVVFVDDTVRYSDDPLYPVDSTKRELFGNGREDIADSIAKSGETVTITYGTSSTAEMISNHQDQEGSDVELGYMRAAYKGDYLVMMVMPSSLVFANRSSTVYWAYFLGFAMAVTAYVAGLYLLSKVVAKPIDGTNASLLKIMQGDLDVIVAETSSVEFASLSAGINSTVDALKGLIADAERRMERDLATAKAIQTSALPRTFPPFPEIDAFDIYASMNAAKEVGGDFFDFFLIDDHTLGFLIADVSGKGIPGALFMMAAKTEIENYLSTGMEPAEAIASANRRLCANNDAGMFVTVWAATLDWTTGLLTYVNAGHNFPLLRHGENGTWEWLTKKCGLFLGTFETAKYRQATLTLEAGDELLLYTDGVNEAFNVNEEEFGNDRLEKFLASHTYMGPKDIVRRLRAEVAGWAEGAEQSDDITILALEFGATPDATGSITLPATLDHMSEAMKLVTEQLELRLCPVSTQHKVEIALEELFVNVCNYAYANQDEPGEVTVSYQYRPNPRSISVELRDQGMPFDPVRRQDPTKPESIQEATIGGLGIFMVKRSMDAFDYRREGDTNIVTFRKEW